MALTARATEALLSSGRSSRATDAGPRGAARSPRTRRPPARAVARRDLRPPGADLVGLADEMLLEELERGAPSSEAVTPERRPEPVARPLRRRDLRRSWRGPGDPGSLHLAAARATGRASRVRANSRATVARSRPTENVEVGPGSSPPARRDRRRACPPGHGTPDRPALEPVAVDPVEDQLGAAHAPNASRSAR